MAQGPVTRSQSIKMKGPLELIPVRTVIRMAASSAEAQELFLSMVGLTEALIEVEKENIFPDEMAKLISTALDHELKHDDDEADPYFTSQQWELRCRKWKSFGANSMSRL